MKNYYYGLAACLSKTELQRRKRFLEKTIQTLEERLRNAPKGSLVVTRSSKTKAPGFYHVFDGGNHRVYLNREHQHTIHLLAQKEYDRKALGIAKQEITMLEGAIAYCDTLKVEDALTECLPEKQKYITPVVKTDEAYRQDWLSQKYHKKPPVEGEKLYPTDRGDQVRSKSESMQADYLFHHEYDYLYEKRVVLYDNGRKTYRYPDFTILDPVTRKEVLYEHFGMLDNPEYLRNTLRKLKLYQENGYVIGENLLVTFETHEQPFTIDQLARVLEARFKS